MDIGKEPFIKNVHNVTFFLFLKKEIMFQNNSSKHYTKEVNFDGANGVGTFAMKYVQNSIKDKLKINIFNDEINALGKLNFKVFKKKKLILKSIIEE